MPERIGCHDRLPSPASAGSQKIDSRFDSPTQKAVKHMQTHKIPSIHKFKVKHFAYPSLQTRNFNMPRVLEVKSVATAHSADDHAPRHAEKIVEDNVRQDKHAACFSFFF